MKIKQGILHHLLLLVLFATCIRVGAQNPKIDSLKQAIRTAKHDTAILRLKFELAEQYSYTSPDSAMLYLDSIVARVEMQNPKGESAADRTLLIIAARSNHSKGTIFHKMGKLADALIYYEKAVELYQRAGEEKRYSSCLSNIGALYNSKGDYTKAMEVLNKSVEIKERINDLRGLTQSYHNLGLSYFFIGKVDRAEEQLNKALNAYQSLNDKKGMISALNVIAHFQSSKGQIDKAEQTYKRTIAISTELDDKEGSVQIYIGFANFLKEKGDYTQAEEYLKQALALAKEINFVEKVSAAYYYLGTLYEKLGQFDKSIEAFFSSLKIDEERDDKVGVATNYRYIGFAYYQQADYENALLYSQKALDLSKSINEPRGQFHALNNIGLALSEMGKPSEAILRFEEALSFGAGIVNELSVAVINNNIGIAYGKIGENKRAITYSKKAIKTFEERGDRFNLSAVYENIASYSLKLSEQSTRDADKFRYLDDAHTFGRKAYGLSQEINSMPRQRLTAKVLKDVYKVKKDYKQALNFAEKYISLTDTIFKEEKTKAIADMQTKYETEKKEQEIEKQQLVIEKQEIDNRRQRTQRNFFVAGSMLLALLVLFIFRGYQQKKRSNAIISEKNGQLERANVEIASQRDQVTQQKEHIEQIHGELTSSIRYARRIQSAVLPSPEQIGELLGEHFILFKPKDIVSGDFYWATRVDEHVVFCVADCTGHGVPGAFMSMLGISFLNEIVHKERELVPSEILNRLRESIINALKQRGDGSEQKDGMDMGICVLNSKTLELQVAGGYNPCWVIPSSQGNRIVLPGDDAIEADGPVIQVKPDKMPIAIHKRMEPFTNHVLQLLPGDQVYLMSDGFQDQFGGANGKKFMVKNLRELVFSNSHLTMAQQHDKLAIALAEWQGGAEQVDDITLVGVRV